MDLPDVNVWLALIDQNHVHHTAASRYWLESRTELAFCRVSMLGLLRLSTLPCVLSRPLTAAEAWEIYRTYLTDPQICFLSEPESTEWHFAALTAGTDLSPRLWTDAYLAAFAMAGALRLVSFDSDFARFPGLRFLHLPLMDTDSH